MPLNHRILVPLTALLIMTVSCNRQPKATANQPVCSATGEMRFFDLCSYVDSLIAHYTAGGFVVDKTVSLNGNSEQLTDLEVDWRTELYPLAQSHINRSAWLDRFTADTIALPDGRRLVYGSNRADIPVKRLEVETDNAGRVRLVRVESGRKNLLYTGSQEITFIPGEHYSVRGSQRAMLLSRTTFTIDARIVRRDTLPLPENPAQ